MPNIFPADIVKLLERSDSPPPQVVCHLCAISAALAHVPKAEDRQSFIRLVERFSDDLVHCPWGGSFPLPEIGMEGNQPRRSGESISLQEMPDSAHPLALYRIVAKQRRGDLSRELHQALARSDAFVTGDGVVCERGGSLAMSAAGSEMVVACTTTYQSTNVWHRAESTIDLCAHDQLHLHFRSLEETEGFCPETGVYRDVDGARVSVPLGCIEGCEVCNRDFSVDVEKGVLHGEAPMVTVKIWHFLGLPHDATPGDVVGAMQTPPVPWRRGSVVRPGTGVGSVERMYECLKMQAGIARRGSGG